MNYMKKRIEQSRYLFKRKYRKIRELYAYVFKLKKNSKRAWYQVFNPFVR